MPRFSILYSWSFHVHTQAITILVGLYREFPSLVYYERAQAHLSKHYRPAHTKWAGCVYATGSSRCVS